MLNLIAQVILIGSIIGMIAIIARNISILKALPIAKGGSFSIKNKAGDVFGKVKKTGRVSYSILSKSVKTGVSSVKGSRQKRIEKKEKPKLTEDYWEKIRKS